MSKTTETSNLNIVFNFAGNSITLQCKGNEVVDDVFKRFCAKAGVNSNDVKFYYNSSEVKYSGKTLENLGVKNFFNFSVVSAKHVSGA